MVAADADGWLRFAGDVTPSELRFDGSDVPLRDYLTPSGLIETIRFADGTSWTPEFVEVR